MILSPRYGQPPLLTIDESDDNPLTPIARQHRRLAALVGDFDDEAWATPSRCTGWTARDVIAHLVGVNNFWLRSIQAGLAGHPTTILAAFDPASTPPVLVQLMAAQSNQEVFEQFVSGSEMLLGVLAGLDDHDWSIPAESPAGHVPIRLVVHHALWDSWVHERDIALPLGVNVAEEPDEVVICLRYVAALSPTLGFGSGRVITGRFAVDATNPDVRFVIDVQNSVHAYSTLSIDEIPCVRGGAVTLTDALSLRTPLPPNTPAEWQQLLMGLKATFDAP